MKLFIKIIACLCFFWFTSNAGKPYLLHFSGVYGEASTTNVLKNLAYIETLPFDGVVIMNSATWDGVTNNKSMSYTTLYDENLKPLQGKFSKLKHNFQQVNECKPVDFFDDWSIIIQNWRLCARACKAAGMVGIFYDNEYVSWDYPGSCKYTNKTFQEYRDQIRLRGRQIMEACVTEFPAIRLLTVHGPYVSESAPIMKQGTYPLAGSFFVGMVEGQGSLGLNIDGGEVYGLRTVFDFESHYQFREYTIASSAHNSPNIPVSLRPQWPNLVSISFGLYNRSWSAPMSPAIMRTTVENALKRCDDYIWLYTEGDKWITPGGVSQEWIDSVRSGYNAVKTGIFISSPARAVVQTGNSFNYKVTYDNYNGGTVTITYTKKPSWIIATNGNPSISGTAPNSPSQDTVIAIVAAGGKSDTLKLAISVSSYYLFEAESGTMKLPMQTGSDPVASKSQIITSASGTGNTIFPKVEVTYSFNAPIATAYYVWLRIYKQTIDPASNYGTFVGFNGTFVKPGITNKSAGQYEWMMSMSPNTLPPGSNQLILGHGNEQVKIDQIIITNSHENTLPANLTGNLSDNKINLKKSDLSIRVMPDGSVQFLEKNAGLKGLHLSIRDILGRKMWSNQNEQSNTFIWNPHDGISKIGSGVYFVMLQQNVKNISEIKRFSLVR